MGEMREKDCYLILLILLIPLIPNLLRQTLLKVGTGLAADSDREREWDESLHKAHAQIMALNITSSINE